MKRVGLYFGSFNPIHYGHIQIAELAREQMKLDEVWFIVSPRNPFKENTELADEEHRLQMVRMACSQLDNIAVSEIEFQLPKPSYTIYTLRELMKEFPETVFHIIIGEDNLVSFHQWKEYEALLDLAKLIVYPRLNAAPSIPKQLEKYSGRICFLSGRLLSISATDIREKIKMGETIEGLTPSDVTQYIEANNLFA